MKFIYLILVSAITFFLFYSWQHNDPNAGLYTIGAFTALIYLVLINLYDLAKALKPEIELSKLIEVYNQVSKMNTEMQENTSKTINLITKFLEMKNEISQTN